MEAETLATKFLNDVDRVSEDLINLYGLKYENKLNHLGSPLLRWLDFRLRYVDPMPREIIYSDKFPAKLPKKIKRALKKLERMIIKGQDINSYQGRGLVRWHDTSGYKKQNRTDLLWADLGVTHLHLVNSDHLEKDGFSERSDWLLLCIFVGSQCAFLDIRHHREEDLFSDPKLAEIMIRNWPGYMERFRLKGILPPEDKDKFSAKEIGALRKNGISNFISVDGKAYLGPGGGVTTAATSSKVTQQMMSIRYYIKLLADLVQNPEEEHMKKTKELGIETPTFEIKITPRGLAIYEAVSTIAFLAPVESYGNETNIFSKLQNLIIPTWVISAIANKAPNNPN
jgi:hypothetical protein